MINKEFEINYSYILCDTFTGEWKTSNEYARIDSKHELTKDDILYWLDSYRTFNVIHCFKYTSEIKYKVKMDRFEIEECVISENEVINCTGTWKDMVLNDCKEYAVYCLKSKIDYFNCKCVCSNDINSTREDLLKQLKRIA